MKAFRAAVVQMTSIEDRERNLRAADALARRAAGAGAQLVAFPENFSWMGAEKDKAQFVEALDGPVLGRMAGLARELHVHLLAGSIMERGAPDGRAYNTSVLFGPDGSRIAVYRKIHLFDVAIPDGATYHESKTIAPGSEPVVAKTPLATLGLSVCYDLRFPELYRRLSAGGAEVLTVPSAFTLHTGKDHWAVLLRARAVENLCYVLAPAQFGRHNEKRVTYGHAMIVDPWGAVIAQASDGEGMALADLDPAVLQRVRTELPSLEHRRL
jgi:deaminated glutathione amidase